MSVHGVSVRAHSVNQDPISEAELDRIFLSLESNMAFVSIDIATDLPNGELRFLLGVECPSGLASRELLHGIVEDALEKALEGEDASTLLREELQFTPAFA